MRFKYLTYTQTKRLVKMTEVERQLIYSKIYKHIASFGGGQFGFDWRTTRIRFPHLADCMQAICQLTHRQLS